MRGPFRLSPVIIACAIGAAIVAGALAGDQLRGHWLSPTIGLAPSGGSEVRVAVAANGITVAVWDGNSGIEAAERRPGGSWEAVDTLGSGFYPRLAVDRAGDAIVTMTQGATSKWRVVSYVRTATSTRWEGPIGISDPQPDTGTPDLAANDTGQAVAAWVGAEGALPVIRAAIRRVDGTWGPPENLGYGGSYNGPYTAIDERGDAVVLWTRPHAPGPSQLYAEFRPADGRWESAVLLSNGAADGGNTGVAMNRRGDALAVWGEESDSGGVTLVSALRRAGTSTWLPPSRIPLSSSAAAVYRFDGLSFALDDAGNATLVDQRPDGTVESATYGAETSTWNGPVLLGNGGEENAWYTNDRWCVAPKVALDASGGAVAIWGGDSLFAARRLATQAWEQPVVVAQGPVCFTRALAADADGDAVAIWNASSRAVNRLDAAILDVTPPVLGQPTAPRHAVVGRSLRLSVTVSDRWSSLASPPLWRFGDGGRARGSVVRHVFHRRGRFRVSVVATDKAGNRAVAGVTVTVNAAR